MTGSFVSVLAGIMKIKWNAHSLSYQFLLGLFTNNKPYFLPYDLISTGQPYHLIHIHLISLSELCMATINYLHPSTKKNLASLLTPWTTHIRVDYYSPSLDENSNLSKRSKNFVHLITGTRIHSHMYLSIYYKPSHVRGDTYFAWPLISLARFYVLLVW